MIALEPTLTSELHFIHSQVNLTKLRSFKGGSSKSGCIDFHKVTTHLHDERVVLAAGPEVVDLGDALVTADLLVGQGIHGVNKV